MKLSSLDRDALITHTKSLVAAEKRLELEILDTLREIDRRLLHNEMGYGSLYEFATQFLGLSEASAFRRIAAMRMVREIPEVKVGLESGLLSLTNVAAAQTFFRAERKIGRSRSAAEKKEVLKQLEGLSKRECERKLLEISPERLPREKERPLTPELTEVKLVLDAESMAMIQELKGHLAHALPLATTTEVIKRALQETLAKTRKARGQSAPKTSPAESELQVAAPHAETRRRVFARALHRCEYLAPDGKRCAQTYGLELDHREPRAQGGGDEPDNLRVLCRSHNGFEAARILGTRTMQPYLPSLRSR